VQRRVKCVRKADVAAECAAERMPRPQAGRLDGRGRDGYNSGVQTGNAATGRHERTGMIIRDLSVWMGRTIRRLRSGVVRRRRRGAPSEEQPLRAELLNTRQLHEHVRALARRHVVAVRRGRDLLLPRLAANARVLARRRNGCRKWLPAGAG